MPALIIGVRSAGITDQQKHSMSMNLSSCSSLMCSRATAPTLNGSQRASPRQASGALKNTLVR